MQRMPQDLADDTFPPDKPPLHGEVLVRAFHRDGSPAIVPFVDKGGSFLPRPSKEEPGYIVCGDNLVVDGGRQIIANLLGGRGYSDVTPVIDWIISKVSFGTGDQVARYTDVTLSPQPDVGLGLVGGENEIEITTGVYKKLINSVDFPQPFIVRFECILLPDEANGVLIRELGLWSGNNTLACRKVIVPVSKTADIGLSYLWRLRAAACIRTIVTVATISCIGLAFMIGRWAASVHKLVIQHENSEMLVTQQKSPTAPNGGYLRH